MIDNSGSQFPTRPVRRSLAAQPGVRARTAVAILPLASAIGEPAEINRGCSLTPVGASALPATARMTPVMKSPRIFSEPTAHAKTSSLHRDMDAVHPAERGTLVTNTQPTIFPRPEGGWLPPGQWQQYPQPPRPPRRSGRLAVAVGGGITALVLAAGGGFAAGRSLHPQAAAQPSVSGYSVPYPPFSPGSGTARSPMAEPARAGDRPAPGRGWPVPVPPTARSPPWPPRLTPHWSISTLFSAPRTARRQVPAS